MALYGSKQDEYCIEFIMISLFLSYIFEAMMQGWDLVEHFPPGIRLSEKLKQKKLSNVGILINLTL
jgi:hypothetical protein